MNTKVSAGFNLFDPNPNKTIKKDWENERLAKLARSPVRQRGFENEKKNNKVVGFQPYQRVQKL